MTDVMERMSLDDLSETGKGGGSRSADKLDPSVDLSKEIKLPATVSSVIWSKPETNFVIASVKINKKSIHYKPTEYPRDWIQTGGAIVKCNLLDELNGMHGKAVVFVGKIERHAKYGMQMGAGFCFVDQPVASEGMEEYLKMMPNVGGYRASKLMEAFKAEDLPDIIENHPQRIIALKIGLTPYRVEEMRKKWIEDRAMREVYLWLGDHGVGLDIGAKVVKKWGVDAIGVIAANPYSLTQVKGVGFKTADAIAFKVLDPVPANSRTDSCVNYVLDEAFTNNGHLCLPLWELRRSALALLQVGGGNHDYVSEIAASVSRGVEGKTLKTITVPRTSGPTAMVYRSRIWDMENWIAKGLLALANSASQRTVSENEMKSAEAEISRFMNMDVILNDTQRAGVISAFTNRLTVITGSGGTGKSTLCRCICNIARGKNLKIRQMTPTGKAAKVLQAKTSESAQTIHRALGLMPGLDNISPNSLDDDIVIVDEFSMCGIDTAYAIMVAIANNSSVNLVIVGDHQQLPSVSPGNFFWDIIQSDVAKVVRLDKIYRQGEHSYITTVANNIAHGVNALIPPDADDIKRRNISDAASVPRGSVCEIIRKSMSEKGIPLDDIHTMASMYRGECGVDAINAAIQEMVAQMNGAPAFVATQWKRFFVGDRVMHCENDYDKNVFNGDIGICIQAGHKVFDKEKSEEKEPYIVVKYDDERPDICYRKADFDMVKVAWCTTVHKYQGSQCKYIIFVAPKAHRHMLSKELVYTALTRAEKKVIVIGNQEDLNLCVNKSVASVRYTTLIHQINAIREESPAPREKDKAEGNDDGSISGGTRLPDGDFRQVRAAGQHPEGDSVQGLDPCAAEAVDGQAEV
jgi:exodeoxyribonuclease V alpha subunit